MSTQDSYFGIFAAKPKEETFFDADISPFYREFNEPDRLNYEPTQQKRIVTYLFEISDQGVRYERSTGNWPNVLSALASVGGLLYLLLMVTSFLLTPLYKDLLVFRVIGRLRNTNNQLEDMESNKFYAKKQLSNLLCCGRFFARFGGEKYATQLVYFEHIKAKMDKKIHMRFDDDYFETLDDSISYAILSKQVDALEQQFY